MATSRPSHQVLIDRLLAAFPDLLAVYLFGSYGTLYERADSDVDIGVLLPPTKRIDPSYLWDMAQELATVCHRDVDLIDMRHTATLLCHEIVTRGKRIFCSDPDLGDEFEIRAISDYLDYNESIDPLLHDILRKAA